MARRHNYIPEESSETMNLEMGQDWLEENDPMLIAERAILEGSLEGKDLVGMSMSGLMEHRVKSMPTGVQQAVRSIFGGNPGTLSARIAAENFLDITGEDPAKFARRIKAQASSPLTVTKIDGSSYTTSPAPYSKADMRIAIGMFSEEGIDKYVNRGAGSAQEGNTYGVEVHEKAYRAALSDAYATLGALASATIDPLVPHGSAAYETRHLQAQEELIKFGMEATGRDRYRMPNPNDLHFRGRRQTIGRGGRGTPFTQLEYDTAISEGGSLYGQNEGQTFFYIPSGYKSYDLSKGEFNEMQDAYLSVMETIRRSTLTTTDEVWGNTQRLSGYQKDRIDWDEKTDAMNEAAIQDMDMYQPDMSTLQGSNTGGIYGEGGLPDNGSMPLPSNLMTEQDIPDMRTLQGSNTGGMYGEKGLSERDVFVENYTSASIIDPLSAQGKYIELMRDAPKQGSNAWLNQRKQVDFTASTIGMLGLKSGTDKLAVNMWFNRQQGLTEGYDWQGRYTSDNRFVGNSYTKEGQVFESDVRKFFMAKHGKPQGLTFQEAYFERGEGNLSNFGVTPDGRLYDKEGNSAGLAEFKLKRNGLGKNILEDYYDQVQLQMAVTGETQTHLFGLDQHTDETYYHLVEADPERQEFLIEQANEAKAISEGLTSRGTLALMKTIKGRKTAKANAADGVAGEEARLQSIGKQDDSVEAFTPHSGSAAKSLLAKGMAAADQRDKMKTALANAKEVEDLDFVGPPESPAGAKGRKDLATQRLKASADYERYQQMTSEETHGEANRMDETHNRKASASLKKLSSSASDSSSKLLAFSAGLSKVGAVLSAITDKFLGTSAMETKRFAQESGMDTSVVRGQHNMMLLAGMSETAITQNISRAADMSRLSKTYKSAAELWGQNINVEMLHLQQTTPSLRDWKQVDIQAKIGSSQQDLIGEFFSLIEGKDLGTQKAIAKIWGMSEQSGIASPKVTGEGIATASEFFDDKGALAQREGVAKGKILKQRFDEINQTGSKMLGLAAELGKSAAEHLAPEKLIAAAVAGTSIILDDDLSAVAGTSILDDDLSFIEPTNSFTKVPGGYLPYRNNGKTHVKVHLTVNNQIEIDSDLNVETNTDIEDASDSQFNTRTGAD